jgi:hypothetical protein
MNLFGLNITIEKAPKDTRKLHEKLGELGSIVGSGIGKGIEKTAEVTTNVVESSKAAVKAFNANQAEIAKKREAVAKGVAQGSQT